MNRVGSFLGRVAKHREPKVDGRVKISNLTRQSELADAAEMADTAAKRRKGLLGQSCLAPGQGLWILPCEAVHTVGMQFPIDLVYLGRNMRVKKVRSHVRPWRISACLTAHSVLELPSGRIRESRTQPGDQLEVSSAAPEFDRPVLQKDPA